MTTPRPRAVRTLLALLVLALPSGCLLPFGGGGAEGTESATMDGDPQWVSAVVVTVFHEVGVPVREAGPDAVHSGTFRIEDGWLDGRAGDRVACGGDAPLGGEVIEMRVDAYIADASLSRPPDALPPGPPPPGQVPARGMGTRSRVTLSSEGRQLTGAGTRCTLRQEFVDEILDRVVARTGGRRVVAERKDRSAR